MAETATAVKWLQLDRGRRRRVARAVRRGRAVDDPRDAPYAVGFAEASLDWLSWKRRFRPLHLLLLTLVLAELGLLSVTVQMPGQGFFRPGSRFRRRFVLSLALVLGGALALAVAATAWTIRENHRWAKRANPICAREHARLAALRDRQLDPIVRQLRWNAIERDTLVALDSLKARTRLQRSFVAWRRYELQLGVWLVGRLYARDDYWIPRGDRRLESARATSRRIARLIGAKTCARV